jgi:hypothetical protein
MNKVKFVSKQEVLQKKISKLERELQDMKEMFAKRRRLAKENEQAKHESGL